MVEIDSEVTRQTRMMSMKEIKTTPTPHLMCLMILWTHARVCHLKGLTTMTVTEKSLKKRVVKMTYYKVEDNHIKTTVVDSREGMNLKNHYRVLERVIKMPYYKVSRWLVEDNQIKMTVEDLREGHMMHSSTN
jgi:hypothetical protein